MKDNHKVSNFCYSIVKKSERKMTNLKMIAIILLILNCFVGLISGSKCPVTSSCASPEDKRLQKEIDNAINGHTVTVFSRTTCPYSKRVKKILREHYQIKDLYVVETDLHRNMCGMMDCLNIESGIHTVPQVFVNGTFLGNHDKLMKLHETGMLNKILLDAKAI